MAKCVMCDTYRGTIKELDRENKLLYKDLHLAQERIARLKQEIGDLKDQYEDDHK